MVRGTNVRLQRLHSSDARLQAGRTNVGLFDHLFEALHGCEHNDSGSGSAQSGMLCPKDGRTNTAQRAMSLSCHCSSRVYVGTGGME